MVASTASAERRATLTQAVLDSEARRWPSPAAHGGVTSAFVPGRRPPVLKGAWAQLAAGGTAPYLLTTGPAENVVPGLRLDYSSSKLYTRLRSYDAGIVRRYARSVGTPKEASWSVSSATSPHTPHDRA